MAAAPNKSGQLQNEALNRPRFNLGFFVPTGTKIYAELIFIGEKASLKANNAQTYGKTYWTQQTPDASNRGKENMSNVYWKNTKEN